jgi:hypothetical protein
MQLIRNGRYPMVAPTSLFAPIVAAERRLISAPTRALPIARRRFELNWEDLIRSVEISDEEVLDDLLYPADHRALQGGRSD